MTKRTISIVLSLCLILSMALASQPSQVNAATSAPKAIDGYTYQRTLSETVTVEDQKDQEANKAIGLAIVGVWAGFHSFTAGTVITALGLEGPIKQLTGNTEKKHPYKIYHFTYKRNGFPDDGDINNYGYYIVAVENLDNGKVVYSERKTISRNAF
ncbi:hypothetical protein ACP2W0_19285 [Pseudobacillus badius]|uniref:hypothetical protein n=1 Tax=Bacillus badius TaxID=1455 RepID=UPI003CF8F87D